MFGMGVLGYAIFGAAAGFIILIGRLRRKHGRQHPSQVGDSSDSGGSWFGSSDSGSDSGGDSGGGDGGGGGD